MKSKIRYDLIGAAKANVTLHPQNEVERLGMKVESFEGVPIGDCAIMIVANVPDNLPNYIDIL